MERVCWVGDLTSLTAPRRSAGPSHLILGHRTGVRRVLAVRLFVDYSFGGFFDKTVGPLKSGIPLY